MVSIVRKRGHTGEDDAQTGVDSKRVRPALSPMDQLSTPIHALIASFLDVKSHVVSARASRSALRACKSALSWAPYVKFQQAASPSIAWIKAWSCRPQRLSVEDGKEWRQLLQGKPWPQLTGLHVERFDDSDDPWKPTFHEERNETSRFWFLLDLPALQTLQFASCMRMSHVHELLRTPSLTELQLPGDVWFVWDKQETVGSPDG